MICALLLFATMLNYMDRQTLSLTILRMDKEIHLTNAQYGSMEFGFGMAFAAGGLLTGFIVDRVSVRWLYPMVLIGWSLAGIATAVYPLEIGNFVLFVIRNLLELLDAIPSLASFVDHWTGALFPHGGAAQSDSEFATGVGLMSCRVVLGLFEAGHWPCALVVTQRILAARERSFGNSLLQSGAAFGAILTPGITWLLVHKDVGGWKPPFIVIGALGMSWVVPWLLLVRRSDLASPSDSLQDSAKSSLAEELPERRGKELWLRLIALVVVVIGINMSWQFFRAWLPKLLVNQHHYDEDNFVYWFVMAFYIAADIGCITAGYVTRKLANRGLSIHRARMITFASCTVLTSAAIFIADLHKGPLLLALILIFGFGSLGLFPNFYSFTQEISGRNQGKVTGTLGATTWIVVSFMHTYVGAAVDKTDSYRPGLLLSGIAPIVALAALLLFWPRARAAGKARDI